MSFTREPAAESQAQGRKPHPDTALRGEQADGAAGNSADEYGYPAELPLGQGRDSGPESAGGQSRQSGDYQDDPHFPDLLYLCR